MTDVVVRIPLTPIFDNVEVYLDTIGISTSRLNVEDSVVLLVEHFLECGRSTNLLWMYEPTVADGICRVHLGDLDKEEILQIINYIRNRLRRSTLKDTDHIVKYQIRDGYLKLICSC